jgi:hypothetical protein
MNIFVLDKDPKIAAQYHVNKHIVKMPLETAQLLCGVHHLSGTNKETIPYRLTHKNHPCSIWARKSLSNYMWLCKFGLELCYEYTHRYEKVHKCQAIIEWCKSYHPDIPVHKCQAIIEWCKSYHPDIPDYGLTSFAQAMPQELKDDNPIKAYRNYYMRDKEHLFAWKNRETPLWIKNWSSHEFTIRRSERGT